MNGVVVLLMSYVMFLEAFMLQGVAALKLKGNIYFLISLHTQSNKHILVMNSICYEWIKDCPMQHFVSRTTFNLKEYISVNFAITVFFNLNINHVYVTGFQKVVTVSIWIFNNFLLNKSCGMLP